MINLTYPGILKQFGKHAVKGATETRALLAWFLENYYRLEDLEIQDAICDGPGDKGIDGVYVNDQLRQFDFLQGVLFKSGDKTLGDAKLKQFTGALQQFSTIDGAAVTLSTASNELKAIAERTDLVKCLSEGYDVRGILVTNALADASATTYISTQTQIALFDGPRLQREYILIDKTEPIALSASFDVSGVPVLNYPIGANLNMVIAPVAASELIGMEGIANGDLFAWNVRQWLGRNTAVNKAVARSIQTAEEHKYFPAYHNGITILCRNLKGTGERIEISGYAVVNGCQSITSLYENEASITSDLRLLTKFIQVEPDSELATKITDHTNNQNGTSRRDLQSNNPTQTRLQSEIHTHYPEYRYRIKRGEHPEWQKESVIDNELLARIILAFDLERHEAWSQNYKLFDDLHAELFARPEMNADRAIFLFEAYGAATNELCYFEDQVFGSYILTRWLVIFLVREALVTEPLGKSAFSNPGEFLKQLNGRQRMKGCIGRIARVVVRVLNAEIKRRTKATGYFDYKKELKNKEFILGMASVVIAQYEVILDSGLADGFERTWTSSHPRPREWSEHNQSMFGSGVRTAGGGDSLGN